MTAGSDSRSANSPPCTDSLAGRFVAKAWSDLGRAQDMAISDQSGQTLGTSMYLCQQSVEKAFKSVLLSLQERMGLKLDGRYLHLLSHSLYPKLSELYRNNVSTIRLPRLPPEHERLIGSVDSAGVAAAAELECFKELSSSWDSKGTGDRLRILAWRHSVGDPLGQKDLDELNSFHMPALRLIYASVFREAREPVPLANEKRPSGLITKIRGGGLSRADYDIYVAGRNYAPMHSTIHSAYRMTSGFIESWPEGIPDVNRVPRSEVIRRAILEFGFRVLALAAHPYHIFYPHSTMGRYPEGLGDGRFTDDVYAAQAEYVIKALYLEGRYLVWELCTTTALVDKLWEKGKKAGLW